MNFQRKLQKRAESVTIRTDLKGVRGMGNAIHDNDSQVLYLKQRLSMFLEVLESVDAESTDLDDIDRMIQMLDDLELKVQQFKKDDNES